MLLKYLEEEAGGDGNGIGGFVDGKASIAKDIKHTTNAFAFKMLETKWDSGVLFHTRRASVGIVNDDNCHPFVWNNAITIHNGHIEGAGLLKLIMLENIEKYGKDGWTFENLTNSTDSNILSYFIQKHGFEIVPLLNPGTVLTMYPDRVEVYVGSYGLQDIRMGTKMLYASSFPPEEVGMKVDEWEIFEPGSRLTIMPDGSYKMHRGTVYDGKQLYLERKKIMEANKDIREVA